MTQFGLFITELLYVFERLGMQHTSYMDNFYNISMVLLLFFKLKSFSLISMEFNF